MVCWLYLAKLASASPIVFTCHMLPPGCLCGRNGIGDSTTTLRTTRILAR